GKSVKRERALGRRWKLAKNSILAASALALLFASAIFALRALNRNDPLSSIPEAKALYDRGVFHLQSRTLDGTLQAYSNLTDAVKWDPRFVDAYFMLFEVFV